MGHRHSSRRRGQARFDDDFPAYGPYQPYQTYQPYDAYDSYEQYAPRSRYPQEHSPPPRSPPRRSRTERHRREPSPYHYYSDEPTGSSHRHKHRRPRQEHQSRGRSAGPSHQGGGFTPPPIIPDPDHEPSRWHNRSSRHERDAPREKDSRFMDPYEQDFHTRDPLPRHHPTGPPDRQPQDLPYRSRSVHQNPPPEPRSRGRNSRRFEYDDDDYVAAPRRRPRSQPKGHRDRDPSGPSPARGRPPPTQRSRDPTARRSSMPASTKPRTPWWQNPLVQASARGALTAGAQAAIKSRGDPSPWIGPKGAKVATAALGAAFVDGFIGQKHPKSTRQNIAKQGVDFATEKVAASAGRHRRS